MTDTQKLWVFKYLFLYWFKTIECLLIIVDPRNNLAVAIVYEYYQNSNRPTSHSHCHLTLQKSLPLLRHSLATQELTIDGIHPPPANVVFSIAGATPTVQTVRPAGLPSNQVRIVAPGSAVVRPAQVSNTIFY